MMKKYKVLIVIVSIFLTSCSINNNYVDDAVTAPGEKNFSYSFDKTLTGIYPSISSELLNYSILPHNGGLEKVIHMFEDDTFCSIDEYSELELYCAEEYKETINAGYSLNVAVAEYDFNDDKQTDYIIKISSSFYGKLGSIYKLLLNHSNKNYKEINIGHDSSTIGVMQSKSNELYDISSSSIYFHGLLKYDGADKYSFENPSPLLLSNLGTTKNNYSLANGKIYCKYNNGMIGGDAPQKENLPFYVGIKIDFLSDEIKSPILWACDEKGKILSFNDISLLYYCTFVADVWDEESIINEIKLHCNDGYLFPDDVVFAYIPNTTE